MSVEAVIDVIVHFGNFKTFDMLAQGTYRLRIKGYIVEPNGLRTSLVPYLILDNRFSKHKLRQKLFEPEIDSRDNSVGTSSFYIRYCDQECIVDHISIFRIASSGAHFLKNSIFFEIDLYSLDLEVNKPPKQVKTEQVDRHGFVKLTSSVMRLSDVSKGIHEYHPVIFGDYMFSYIESHFHTTTMSSIK